MTQLAISFVQTRARRNDSSTSKDAAKAAVSRKADMERAAITSMVRAHGFCGMTAREAAIATGIDYIEVQRRISECGMTKTIQRRNGCAVWLGV